jgi:hypothetical protein
MHENETEKKKKIGSASIAVVAGRISEQHRAGENKISGRTAQLAV